MKSNLKRFDSHLMNFMIYELLFGENQAHFLKSSFHLEKKMIYFEILQVCFN
jgi:hypothetical protein